LEILESQSFEIGGGGQPFNPIGISLIGALVVPKPVNLAVGQDDKRDFQGLRISSCLLLSVVGIGIFPLGFQNAEGTLLTAQDIIRPSSLSVKLESNLFRVEKVPAAFAQCPVE
jgi:hypothetical protein